MNYLHFSLKKEKSKGSKLENTVLFYLPLNTYYLLQNLLDFLASVQKDPIPKDQEAMSFYSLKWNFCNS